MGSIPTESLFFFLNIFYLIHRKDKDEKKLLVPKRFGDINGNLERIEVNVNDLYSQSEADM